ncbi:MAG: hypothetical protein MJE77_19715 [Proteobacteria bacterium]|nr:hypothetical protein [Pseudomonadota bacterium]
MTARGPTASRSPEHVWAELLDSRRGGRIGVATDKSIGCLLGCFVAACSGTSTNQSQTPQVIPVPVRASTAGDALMAMAPAGADLVVEIDMARLRHNQVVGPVFTRLATLSDRSIGGDLPGEESVADASSGFRAVDVELFRHADTVLFCAYHVGTDRASALTILAGPEVDSLELVRTRGRPVGHLAEAGSVWVIGPRELVDRVQAVARSGGSALSDDRELLAQRARIMPAAASGASLRIAARLDFDARVALAARLGLDRVPTGVAVWGDVADDLAVVAAFRAETADGVSPLAGAAEKMRNRIAGHPWVRRHLLHFTVHTIDIRRRDGEVRAVLVIGPSRLARLMKRAAGFLDRLCGADCTAAATEQQ